MSLCLEYPVLKSDSMDFEDGVEFTVHAKVEGDHAMIDYSLRGDSVLSWMLENDKAFFSSSLRYSNNSIRKFYRADGCKKVNATEIVASQSIRLLFDEDLPEIKPSIISAADFCPYLDGVNIPNIGLSEFWNGQEFTYPASSRIAIADTLNFNQGGLSSLIELLYVDTFEQGALSVSLNISAEGNKPPVTVKCSKNVYDTLRLIVTHVNEEDVDAQQAFNSAIVTNVLTAVYNQIKLYNLNEREEFEPQGELEAHLDLLKEKTGQDWRSDEFDPEMAASRINKFLPDGWSNKR